MGQPYFQFKKFRIDQEHCAQKVGTLSCILGALATHPLPENILDIGTGTGLLALMMAQRFSNVNIDAVEIDSDTAKQARQNFSNSPWDSKLQLINQDILSFQPALKYDLIISNPPFYKGQQHTRHNLINLARHSLALHHLQLVPWIASNLKDDGKSWILLPPREMEQMDAEFKSYGFGSEQLYQIFVRPESPEKARIACFSRNFSVARRETFYIHTSSGAYSDPFVDLLQSFYLHL
ncbi:MAG: methyltransferase [Cyclobacteriaceae bacterium]|nr:methyltransferase [Cyclobacteriaceae bacterium]